MFITENEKYQTEDERDFCNFYQLKFVDKNNLNQVKLHQGQVMKKLIKNGKVRKVEENIYRHVNDKKLLHLFSSNLFPSNHIGFQ